MEDIVKRLIKIRTAISKLTKELQEIHKLLKEPKLIEINEAILHFK